MPTIEDWNECTTRAAHLGYRVLIVAGSHIELIDAASGRCVGRVGAWADVEVWLDEAERMMSRKKAA